MGQALHKTHQQSKALIYYKKGEKDKDNSSLKYDREEKSIGTPQRLFVNTSM